MRSTSSTLSSFTTISFVTGAFGSGKEIRVPAGEMHPRDKAGESRGEIAIACEGLSARREESKACREIAVMCKDRLTFPRHRFAAKQQRGDCRHGEIHHREHPHRGS